MNWHRISRKRDLIDELKQATRKVRSEVVFENCRSWTVRLQKVYRNDGRYLDKQKRVISIENLMAHFPKKELDLYDEL